MRFLMFSLAAVALTGTACSEDFSLRPSYFPTAYKYEHETYKAAPGPEAPDIGYKYNRIDNASVMGVWMEIADALVSKLEATGNVGAGAVYIERLAESNAFNESYDVSLRQAFRDRGYTLVGMASPDALHIRYEGYRTQDAQLRNKEDYNEEANPFLKPYYPEKAADFTFVLTAAQGGQVIGQSYVERTIPAYGYIADEGQHEKAERIRPKQPAPKRIADPHNR